jgi:hypothetical protein
MLFLLILRASKKKPGRVLLANIQALFGIEGLPLARLSAAHSITKLS